MDKSNFIKDKDNVLIFDAMAVATKINIQKYKLKTCQDFPDVLSKIILSESQELSEVRVLLDRYEELSWKSKTWEHRTTGVQIQYKYQKHFNSKVFIKHTKKELTKHQSNKLYTDLSEAGKNYVVVYNNTAVSNLGNFPDKLKFHSHEEADTLIILHAINVA